MYDTDETVITGSGTGQWYVYVIDCKWDPPGQYDDAWVYAAADAKQRLYVGSTNDLERRMQEHIQAWENRKMRRGKDDNNLGPGSEFTKKFKPEKLVAIHYVDGEREAREQEAQIARDLEEPGVFVYQA